MYIYICRLLCDITRSSRIQQFNANLLIGFKLFITERTVTSVQHNTTVDTDHTLNYSVTPEFYLTRQFSTLNTFRGPHWDNQAEIKHKNKEIAKVSFGKKIVMLLLLLLLQI